MAIRGNTAGIDHLAAQVRRVGTGAFRGEVSQRIGRRCMALLRKQFNTGRDCYGRPWAPVLRGGTPLEGLLAGLSAGFNERGVRIAVSSNKWYAAVHQTGKTINAKQAGGMRFRVGDRWVTKQQVKIPRRQIWPTEGDLGPIWGRAIDREAVIVLQETVLGGQRSPF